jgi:hypothetical protein
LDLIITVHSKRRRTRTQTELERKTYLISEIKTNGKRIPKKKRIILDFFKTFSIRISPEKCKYLNLSLFNLQIEINKLFYYHHDYAEHQTEFYD